MAKMRIERKQNNVDDKKHSKSFEDELKEEVKILKEKVNNLENIIDKILKKTKKVEEGVKIPTKYVSKPIIKCKICHEYFDKNVELENHITMDHTSKKDHQCTKCEKSFHLKWRLEKHKMMHESEKYIHCHYFNNDKKCPFEEVGCKFIHKKTNICKYGENCNRHLCQFQHEESVSKPDTITGQESSEEKNVMNISETRPELKSDVVDEAENLILCVHSKISQGLRIRRNPSFGFGFVFDFCFDFGYVFYVLFLLEFFLFLFYVLFCALYCFVMCFLFCVQ